MEKSISKIKVFENKNVRTVWNEEEEDWYFSVIDVVEILSCQLIGIIPEDTGIITSTNKGEPIVNDENALAGKAYRNVAERILGEEVPFLDLDEPKGLMAKLKNAIAKLKVKV